MITFQPINISVPDDIFYKTVKSFNKPGITTFNLSAIKSPNDITAKIIKNIFEDGHKLTLHEFSGNKKTIREIFKLFGKRIRCNFPYSQELDEFKHYIKFSEVTYTNTQYDPDIAADIINIENREITGTVDIGETEIFNACNSCISGFTGAASKKINISNCGCITDVVDIGETEIFNARNSRISGFTGAASKEINISLCENITGVVDIGETEKFNANNSRISGFTGTASKEINISNCGRIIGIVDIGKTEIFNARNSFIFGFIGTASKLINISECENMYDEVNIGKTEVFYARYSHIPKFIGTVSTEIDISGRIKYYWINIL